MSEESNRRDLLGLTAEDFAKLDDWEMSESLQLIAGRMAEDQGTMRDLAEAYHGYMSAKESFGRWKALSSVLQTLLRVRY